MQPVRIQTPKPKFSFVNLVCSAAGRGLAPPSRARPQSASARSFVLACSSLLGRSPRSHASRLSGLPSPPASRRPPCAAALFLPRPPLPTSHPLRSRPIAALPRPPVRGRPPFAPLGCLRSVVALGRLLRRPLAAARCAASRSVRSSFAPWLPAAARCAASVASSLFPCLRGRPSLSPSLACRAPPLAPPLSLGAVFAVCGPALCAAVLRPFGEVAGLCSVLASLVAVLAPLFGGALRTLFSLRDLCIR